MQQQLGERERTVCAADALLCRSCCPRSPQRLRAARRRAARRRRRPAEAAAAATGACGGRPGERVAPSAASSLEVRAAEGAPLRGMAGCARSTSAACPALQRALCRPRCCEPSAAPSAAPAGLSGSAELRAKCGSARLLLLAGAAELRLLLPAAAQLSDEADLAPGGRGGAGPAGAQLAAGLAGALCRPPPLVGPRTWSAPRNVRRRERSTAARGGRLRTRSAAGGALGEDAAAARNARTAEGAAFELAVSLPLRLNDGLSAALLTALLA